MKNRPKALVVDFDNTLVGRDFIVVDELKVLIEELLKRGIVVSIATGRPYFGVIKRTCTELDLTAPQITHGGAEIYNPKTDEIIWGKYIPSQQMEELLEFLRKEGVYVIAEKEDAIYTTDGGDHPFYGGGLRPRKLSELELEAIPKFIISATYSKLSKAECDRLREKIEGRYKNLHIITVKVDENYGLDVTAEQASKHVALLELIKLTGVDREKIVGVGDNYNDYPLLTAAGTKIAMGDAPVELKEIADHVVSTQKEGGLIEVIENFFNVS